MHDTYEVLAVRYAENARQSSENFIGGDLHDRPMPLDYFVWVIRNDTRTVIVDSGFNPDSGSRRARKLVTPVNEALEAVGVVPATIKDVITTHMHYDHAGNNDLFPDACFHMQETEMSFATGPCMCHAHANHPYEADDVAGMVRRVYAGQVSFRSGDGELFPGITVHHIGGHSRGLQCVRVQTERGPIVLASDATHHYDHMALGKVFPTCDSVSDALHGYNRLRALGGDASRIIPGHDPEVMRRYPAYSEATKEIAVKLDKPEITDFT